MSGNRIAHVPALDGLRGAAVIGVLLFHSKGLLRGGYLGVDLFFVLSGYLITSLLLAEKTIDLKGFWIRRARRLLPALLSIMPAVAVHAALLASWSERASLRREALATIGYVANWRAIYAHKSYWQMFDAPSPLEHTWSLAIEEQFYVVWPLVVMALLRLGGRRAVLWASVALAIASAVTMFLLHESGNTMRVYLGTDTRGAAILVGAVLASAGIDRTARAGMWLDALGLGGLVLLVVAWLRLDGQSDLLYRGGFWVTELAALSLIACSVHRPGGIVARIFSIAPLRLMGIVSYGVYLWHWPIFVWLSEERTHLAGVSLLAVRFAVTLIVAVISYRVLEKPIRQRGLSWGSPWVIVPSAFGLVIAIVLVSTRASAEPRTMIAQAYRPRAALVPGAPKWFPPSRVFPPDLPPERKRILVLGDSVALSLGNRMYWSQGADAFVVQRAIGDCSILDPILPVHSMGGDPHGNGDCSASWKADVEELHPDVTVVLFGGAFFSKVKVDGRWRSVCDPGWSDAFSKRLGERLSEIAPSAGKRFVVLPPPPVGKWESPSLADDVACFVRAVRSGAGDVPLIDLPSKLCPSGRCQLEDKGAPVRPDGLHFDGLGAETISRWALDQVL